MSRFASRANARGSSVKRKASRAQLIVINAGGMTLRCGDNQRVRGRIVMYSISMQVMAGIPAWLGTFLIILFEIIFQMRIRVLSWRHRAAQWL